MTFRPFVRLALVASLCFGGLAAAFATTVNPPAFASLVNQADYVVRATVTGSVCEWKDTAGQRVIVTKVSLDVLEVISGTPPTPLVLELLGGQVGERSLEVHGSPKLRQGQEYILFIHGNGTQLCPTVALMYGVYPVIRDSAVSGPARVARANGRPLRREQDVELPLHQTAASTGTSAAAADEPALTTDVFIQRIRSARLAR